MRRWVILAALAALAYWLYKRFAGGDVLTPTGDSPSSGPPSTLPPAEPPRATPPAEFAGPDVPDDPQYDVMLRNRGLGAFQNQRVNLMNDWYHQFYLPASRVPLSSLTAADFKLAARFLSYACDRNGEKECDRMKDLQQQYDDQQTGALITKIFAGIAAEIPYVGPILSQVISSQTQELNVASVGTLTQENLVKSLRGVFDPASLDPASNMWLSPLEEEGEVVADKMKIYLDILVAPLNPDGDWQAKDGTRFHPHARWLSICQSGYILPWLSYELGMREGLRTRIQYRAKLLRTLDLIVALHKPIIPRPGSSIYCYRNSVFGDVVGSAFPPIWPEDGHLINNGRMYDYDGRDITQNLAQIDVAGEITSTTKTSDDTKLSPSPSTSTSNNSRLGVGLFR